MTGTGITGTLGSVATGQASASEAADEFAGSVPVIGESLRGVVRKNASWIDGIGSFLSGLWHMLQSFVLGIVDSFAHTHQKEAETNSVTAVNSQATQFTTLAQTLHLNPTFATKLQADVDSATRGSFGFMGLSQKPDDAIAASRALQATLENDIRAELLTTYGQRISDGDAQKIARDAAASITGLNLTDLNSDSPELRLRADHPTQGFGGMLFALQSALGTTNAPAPNPTFRLDSTALQTVQQDMATWSAPPPSAAPAAPPAPRR